MDTGRTDVQNRKVEARPFPQKEKKQLKKPQTKMARKLKEKKEARLAKLVAQNMFELFEKRQKRKLTRSARKAEEFKSRDQSLRRKPSRRPDDPEPPSQEQNLEAKGPQGANLRPLEAWTQTQKVQMAANLLPTYLPLPKYEPQLLPQQLFQTQFSQEGATPGERPPTYLQSQQQAYAAWPQHQHWGPMMIPTFVGPTPDMAGQALIQQLNEQEIKARQERWEVPEEEESALPSRSWPQREVVKDSDWWMEKRPPPEQPWCEGYQALTKTRKKTPEDNSVWSKQPSPPGQEP